MPKLRLFPARRVMLGWLAAAVTATASARSEEPAFVPTSDYATRSVQGWTVKVNRRLLAEKSEIGKNALNLLERKLAEIRATVPPSACERLQEVPIWLGVDDGHAPCSEYHPSRDWLKAHGYNPDKTRCVEIGNASKFLAWSADQPSMVLHELAHAYHDRVLGFNNKEVRAAYQKALASGRYDKVKRVNGHVERAYALRDPQEFFAEMSEAYFGKNDFFPFDRRDLEKYDPEVLRLLAALWGDQPRPSSERRDKPTRSASE